MLSSLELGYGFVLLCQEENHMLLLDMTHSLLISYTEFYYVNPMLD